MADVLLRNRIKSEPQNARAWDNLGRTYSDLKRYDYAIEVYRKAVRINPKHVYAWNDHGWTYVLYGNKAAAMDVVRKLRRLDPARADKLINLIMPH